MADIAAAFYDAGDSDRQMLTDPVFQGMLVPVTVDGDMIHCYLKDGVVTFQRAVTADAKAFIQFDFTRLDTNLILEQPVSSSMETGSKEPPISPYSIF